MSKKLPANAQDSVRELPALPWGNSLEVRAPFGTLIPIEVSTDGVRWYWDGPNNQYDAFLITEFQAIGPQSLKACVNMLEKQHPEFKEQCNEFFAALDAEFTT